MKSFIKFVLNAIPRKYLIRLSYIFTKLSRFIYYGNKVECPVCKGWFRKFLPYGYEIIRENAMCPGCLSLERHRIMYLYLQQRTSFFTDSLKVLHVAPEQCFYKKFRKLKNLTYETADLESPLADHKCDIQALPFKDNVYDIVICNHVLEHVADDKKAMREILRVIKPEGFAILQVPVNYSRTDTFEDSSITDSKERTKIFGQYDHVRVFGTDYPERLKSVGFVINEANYTELLSEEDKNRYGVNIKEYMFACRKNKIM